MNHELRDTVSLAFDRLAAERIAADPALIDRARATLTRWLATCSPRVRPVLIEWQTILDGPRESLLALLVATDERATRLRQSSPFAGIFSPAERSAILKQFQSHDPAAA